MSYPYLFLYRHRLVKRRKLLYSQAKSVLTPLSVIFRTRREWWGFKITDERTSEGTELP